MTSDAAMRRNLLTTMRRVRMVEERIAALYPEQEMRCPTHFSIGQEAVAAGVCARLMPDDKVVSAHRSHAHYLCRGGDLKRMLAELYGKIDGCAKGKGGSMHLIDLSVGFLGCVPIVGSTIPIGVGTAFTAHLTDQPGVSVVFFGDGATEAGVFHESLNFARLHRLPVVFVCENNLYSVNTPLQERQPASRTIAELAQAHDILAIQEDGQDVDRVYDAAGPLIECARRGEGPVLLEFMTYRWLEHCGPLGDTHLGFRPPGEFESWIERCPIKLYTERLSVEGIVDEAGLALVREDLANEIDDAIEFAKQSPFPDRNELMADVYG